MEENKTIDLEQTEEIKEVKVYASRETLIDDVIKLCSIPSLSGFEYRASEKVREIYEGKFDEIYTDLVGNQVLVRRCGREGAPKILVDAHMDEVGMMITYINSDGTLDFDCVGGIDKRVMLGKPVKVGENRVNGVIGVKAVHMVPADEKLKMPSTMYIDIGADSEEDAEKVVCVGDYACFNSDFVEYGDGFIKGKALDDRAGCAILIEMIRSELEYDCWFSFSTQEEIGTRGAQTAAFTVAPDYAIVVETTTDLRY